MTAHEPSGRVEDDDHDLLTFNEAGARLQESIAQTRDRIARLEATGDPVRLERERDRLRELEDSATRNSSPPINDETFESFFGYRGKARRNIS